MGLFQRVTDPTAPSGQIGGGKPMQPLVRKIGTLLSSYTQAINKRENRTGSLFQKKTQAKIWINFDENNFMKESYKVIDQGKLEHIW